MSVLERGGDRRLRLGLERKSRSREAVAERRMPARLVPLQGERRKRVALIGAARTALYPEQQPPARHYDREAAAGE